MTLFALRYGGSVLQSKVELRVPVGLGQQLRDAVEQPGSHEHVAFGLVGHSFVAGKCLLLLREVIVLSEDDYLPSYSHGAHWKGDVTFRVMGRAMDERLGIIVFHSHGGVGTPRLSSDDMSTATRLLPSFAQRVQKRPHAFIVFSANGASGVTLLPGSNGVSKPAPIDVRWYGKATEYWGHEVNSITKPEFASQRLLVGAYGQSLLSKMQVSVVGLGGGGSHVVQQLAHLGVGKIIGIDDDVVEEKHLHRIVGIRHQDISKNLLKSKVSARLVKELGTGTKFVPINEKVPSLASNEALKGSDVIIGCVDNLHSRAELQDLAWRFLVPYIDIGIKVKSVSQESPQDPTVAISGNTITAVPGNFCLWCANFITDERLQAEPDRNYFSGGGEAQVVSANAIVAALAVNEILRLGTGYAGTGIGCAALNVGSEAGTLSRGYLRLNGVQGEINDWGATQQSSCSLCTNVLGRGIAVWD